MGKKPRGGTPQPPSDIPPEYADAYLRAFRRAYEQTNEVAEVAARSVPSQGRGSPAARRPPVSSDPVERTPPPVEAPRSPTSPAASAAGRDLRLEPTAHESAPEEPTPESVTHVTPSPSAEELVARWTAATAPPRPEPDAEPGQDETVPPVSLEPVVTSVARTGPEPEAPAFKPWVFEPPDATDQPRAQSGTWAFEPPAPASAPADEPVEAPEPNWVEMVPGFATESDVDSWEPSGQVEPPPDPEPTPRRSDGPWVEEEDWQGYRRTAPRWLIPMLTIMLLAALSAAIYFLSR